MSGADPRPFAALSAPVRRALRLSTAEGMLYALMVGCGEAYFLADAIRLGASSLQAGLVIGLPLFTGAAGPVLVLRALARLPRRKGLVVAVILAQALVLLGLGLGEAAGRVTPAILIGAACLYQVCGQAGGTAWSSWFGDLVPSAVRGRYFALRTRWVHVATLAGVSGAGLLLARLEPGSAIEAAGQGGAGFRLIFLLAAGFRALSAVLMACTSEPRFAGLSERLLGFLRTKRGTAIRRVLVLGAALQLLVYAASPYFAPYMLQVLRFGYVEYTVATVCVVLAKVTFLPLWGRVIDDHGPRPTYTLAILLTALIPLPFLFARGLGLVLVAQVLSGMSWAGYEVSHFALILDATFKRTRPQVFAALSVLNGSAQVLGTLLAAPLLLLGGGDLRVLFAFSLVGRLVIGLLAPRLLPQSPNRPPIGRRDLLLRVIGLRAHGGLVHRPVVETEDDDGP